MDYNILSIAELAEHIRALQTPDQVTALQKVVDYRLHLPQLRNALFERLASLLQGQTKPVSIASDVEEDEEKGVSGLFGLHVSTADSVQQDGISYDLSQWITFSEYMQHHGLKSTNIINNWINRGVVPPDCIVTLHRLNDLRLIRNQPYKTIPTE